MMLWAAVTAEDVHIFHVHIFHWALLLLESKQQLRRGEINVVFWTHLELEGTLFTVNLLHCLDLWAENLWLGSDSYL